VTTALNYEKRVEHFKRKLLTQLRDHKTEAEFLWVPEEVRVKSILKIEESIQACGRAEVWLNVAKTTMSAQQKQDLLTLVAPSGQAKIVDRGQPCDIEVAIGDSQS